MRRGQVLDTHTRTRTHIHTHTALRARVNRRYEFDTVYIVPRTDRPDQILYTSVNTQVHLESIWQLVTLQKTFARVGDIFVAFSEISACSFTSHPHSKTSLP